MMLESKANLVLVVLVFAAGSVSAQLPCDSRWRIAFPFLFTHCTDCEGTFTTWSGWGTATVVSVNQSVCESKVAHQQSRNRYNFQESCRSQETETQYTCINCEITYSNWTEWGGNTSTNVSNSNCDDAVQQARRRYSKQEGCDPVQTETRHKCLSWNQSDIYNTIDTLILGLPTHYRLCRRQMQTDPYSIQPGTGQYTPDSGAVSLAAACKRSLQRRAVVPPPGDIFNDWLRREKEKGCIVNDEDVCKPFVKKRSTTTVDDRSADIHSRSTSEDTPVDLSNHHQRFCRSQGRKCNEDRYILYVLDTSGSIGQENFERMKKSIALLTELFCGSPKIAVVTFGHELHVDFCFDCIGFDRNMAARAIRHLQYRHGGSTRTGSAAQCVCNVTLTEQCGLPSNASCIDVVFITDGKSNAGPPICETVHCIDEYASSKNNSNVIVHSIGIGNVNDDELECIATGHGLTHLHCGLKQKYADFEDFEQDVETIMNEIITERLVCK